MPRPPRVDRPGLLHHVMNRAISRRTAFESRRDVRMFLAFVAYAVRAGRIEVHAYSILSTHFHLLVRSLDGRLGETMKRVENGYVRWFNRTRRRDGSLFRGRYRSIPVESVRYLHVLIRYIDQNAVGARVVRDALEHPYGSAASQAGARRRCPWLCRVLVDRFLEASGSSGVGRVDAYRKAFAPSLSPSGQRLVDRRMAGGAREPDVLDDLVGHASTNVRAWMVRKANLADGTRPGLPMAAPETIATVIETWRRKSPACRLTIGVRTDRSMWEVAQVALLRDVAGETFEAIGRRVKLTPGEAWRRYGEHRGALEVDAVYANLVSDLARQALEQECIGSPGGVLVLSGRAISPSGS